MTGQRRLFEYVPHPHIRARQVAGPPKTADQATGGGRVARVNSAIAVVVTRAVGTMWCAYAFAVFDLLALPTAVHGGTYGVVQWVASFFLQLVLLSVIMVGQNTAAAAADARSEATFRDAEAVLAESVKIQLHLEAQDGLLQQHAEALTAIVIAQTRRGGENG